MMRVSQNVPGQVPQTPPPTPPAPPPVPPQVPPRPAFRPGQIELRIDRRTLWIGQAAYPLDNIARVFPVVLNPRYGEAFARFGRRVAITVTVAFVLAAMGNLSIQLTGSSSSRQDSSSSLTGTVVTFSLIVLAVHVINLLQVVLQKPQHAVAIETNGTSVALVTAPDAQRRLALTVQLAAAIDNPGAATLALHVDTLSINPAHYYFGDTVNVHGTGNVGRINT
ncbi:DUF6232 family protein [Kitasatospora griseola]|uniref:DUF6232 family protein n=1 Tax=Kitasatospora griseola TaxID=2064 RepID=UPI0027E4CB33|nr:DUF6232 family protein [Kitasatospora griseola]